MGQLQIPLECFMYDLQSALLNLYFLSAVAAVLAWLAHHIIHSETSDLITQEGFYDV